MKMNKIEMEIEGKTVAVERLVHGHGATIFVNGAEFASLRPLADEQGCFEKARLIMNLCYGSTDRGRRGSTPNYTNSMCHDMKDELTQFIQ